MKALPKILAEHKRVAIVGGPRTGKSTLAAQVTDRPVISTDDTMAQPWADQPEITKRRVEGKDAYVVEGVQAARSVRKGLPVDAIIVMETPKVARTQGQVTMHKGQAKIIADVIARNPGVRVYREGEE